jgi:hypothetical protein
MPLFSRGARERRHQNGGHRLWCDPLRYGFQPTDGNPDGLSITHPAFRRAGECGIPAGRSVAWQLAPALIKMVAGRLVVNTSVLQHPAAEAFGCWVDYLVSCFVSWLMGK